MIKIKIKKLNSFHFLYYCLKFKKKFRKILWEKIREPQIKQQYHPNYLINNLKEDTDLDVFLSTW